MPRNRNYRSDGLSYAQRADNFRRQMADFARGERLKELREARHLSQEEAAHEIGVSVKSLRSWEKGGGIRWPNAKSAGAFYEVDAESLVDRELVDEDEFSDRLARVEAKLDLVLRLLVATYAEQLAPALAEEIEQALREVEGPDGARAPTAAAS